MNDTEAANPRIVSPSSRNAGCPPVESAIRIIAIAAGTVPIVIAVWTYAPNGPVLLVSAALASAAGILLPKGAGTVLNALVKALAVYAASALGALLGNHLPPLEALLLLISCAAATGLWTDALLRCSTGLEDRFYADPVSFIATLGIGTAVSALAGLIALLLALLLGPLICDGTQGLVSMSQTSGGWPLPMGYVVGAGLVIGSGALLTCLYSGSFGLATLIGLGLGLALGAAPWAGDALAGWLMGAQSEVVRPLFCGASSMFATIPATLGIAALGMLLFTLLAGMTAETSLKTAADRLVRTRLPGFVLGFLTIALLILWL